MLLAFDFVSGCVVEGSLEKIIESGQEVSKQQGGHIVSLSSLSFFQGILLFRYTQNDEEYTFRFVTCSSGRFYLLDVSKVQDKGC